MKKTILFAILTIAVNFAFAQYTVTVTTNKLTDTVKTCKDTTVIFYAQVLENGLSVEGSEFQWDFDDGTTFDFETDLDTVEHYFEDEGAYRVRVIAKKDGQESYDIIPILLGIEPDFAGTESNIPENQTGICNGDEITLTGQATPKEWDEDEKINTITLDPAKRIEDENFVNSKLNRRDFPVGDTIENAENIDSIGIFVEHSNTADLQIIATCTDFFGNDKEIILKDFGGVDKYLGEPIDEEGNYEQGTGYWYYFDNTPEYQHSLSNSTTFDATVPSGTYQSFQPFDNFIGCSYNGDWQLTINDNQSTDNGHLFAWSLNFNHAVKADTIIYENIYDLERSYWLGNSENDEGLVSSNGISDAIVEGYGTFQYEFFIYDNFGCRHDEPVPVTVEQPAIEASKTSLYIGETLTATSETSWAVEWLWEFGDKKKDHAEDQDYESESVDKIYLDEDTYELILKATSESGCEDTDTVEIKVDFRPIELAEYNVFTPNGDGNNDIFTFFQTEDDKITLANIEDINGQIINRHGNVVCRWNTTEEVEMGWDGHINNLAGMLAPSGTYFYIVRVRGKDGNKVEPFKGTIYLYR